MGTTTDIEKENLEAHVELCAERYKNLDEKLDNLEGRMDKVEGHLVDIKDKLSTVDSAGNKTLITIGTAILVALMSGFVTLLVHNLK